jgi:hypothetical protein
MHIMSGHLNAINGHLTRVERTDPSFAGRYHLASNCIDCKRLLSGKTTMSVSIEATSNHGDTVTAAFSFAPTWTGSGNDDNYWTQTLQVNMMVNGSACNAEFGLSCGSVSGAGNIGIGIGGADFTHGCNWVNIISTGNSVGDFYANSGGTFTLTNTGEPSIHNGPVLWTGTASIVLE